VDKREGKKGNFNCSALPDNSQGQQMTYGYVRVSTDRQETDNQRFEIER
jgi:hypothetical protein